MNETNMKIFLDIKVPSEFFWVRKIRDVNISKCCAECFIGDSDTRMYHSTKQRQTPQYIELEIEPAERYVAYYLCGLAKNYYYQNNTHIAFINAPGEVLRLETSQINVTISNARRIDFEGEGYIPNPEGEYTKRQRTCRNWVFANYVRDKMQEQLTSTLPVK